LSHVVGQLDADFRDFFAAVLLVCSKQGDGLGVEREEAHLVRLDVFLLALRLALILAVPALLVGLVMALKNVRADMAWCREWKAARDQAFQELLGRQ
jgi:hypothetical protein